MFKGLDEAVKPSLMPNEVVGEDHPVSLDKGLVARFLSLKSHWPWQLRGKTIFGRRSGRETAKRVAPITGANSLVNFGDGQ